MHLLNFSLFENTLYPYVKYDQKGYEVVYNETDFVQKLLFSADTSDAFDVKIQPSAASRYKNGKRAVPEKIVLTFHRNGARDAVIANLNSTVVANIDHGREKRLIREFINIVKQDTSIDKALKDELLDEATPDQLADFLADLLIYAVGVDPLERDKQYPVENYNLPMSNDWFTGREKELQEIADNFSDRCRMQILYGMGGTGKSQIALEYAYDHYRSYSLMHWINAHTIDSIVECYRTFLKEKQIAPADQTKEEICQAYTKFVDSHSDWLLIYDNCDYYTDAEYAEFTNLCLPKNQAVGNILITSRNKRSIGKAKRIEIGVLSDKDAVAFLLQRVESEDSSGAEQLAARLGRFPLALEIAGAYINATPGCDFKTYLGYLEQETKILDRMVEVTDYNETIKEILLLTIKRIKADRNNDALSLCVEDLLHIFSYGAPYDIDIRAPSFFPLEEFGHADMLNRDSGDDNNLENLIEICSDPMKCDELARILIAYGLVTEQPNGLLSMHELQQEIIRNRIYPNLDWCHLLYYTLNDFYSFTEGINRLHYYEHEAYLTKHYEELIKLNVISPLAHNFFYFVRCKAQVSLLLEQFKDRLSDNAKIGAAEFDKRDAALMEAVEEMAMACEAIGENMLEVAALSDYLDRLLDVTMFYRTLHLPAPSACCIILGLQALHRSARQLGDDVLLTKLLHNNASGEIDAWNFRKLLREIRLCFPPALLEALLTGNILNESSISAAKWFRNLLPSYAEIVQWDKAELDRHLRIIDAYIEIDPDLLL